MPSQISQLEEGKLYSLEKGQKWLKIKERLTIVKVRHQMCHVLKKVSSLDVNVMVMRHNVLKAMNKKEL